MGRAHSNGWKQASNFFNLEAEPILKIACGRNESELKNFANKWGWNEISTDWKSILERKDIDVIDIATPTYLHHDMAIMAAQHGKHIFCEKPIALDPDIIRNALAEVEKSGVKLQVGFNRCFDPNFAAVQEQIASEHR